MKLKQLLRSATLSATCLLAVPITCNSILAKSTPQADDGYEYVTQVGSNILKRVKKGSRPDSTSGVRSVSAEGFRTDVSAPADGAMSGPRP